MTRKIKIRTNLLPSLLEKQPVKYCYGFNLIELAIVLFVAGLMLTLFNGFAVNAITNTNNQLASDRLSALSNKLLIFAQNNYRLPCPDTSNNGLENCTTNVTLRGNIPYKTLNLEQPYIGSKGGEVIYALAANLGITHNLDQPSWQMNITERRDMCDFIATLALRVATVDDLAVADPGITSCSATTLTNPAFVLSDSGNSDLDGNNGLFDGLNGVTSNNCFNSPLTPISSNYDDSVQAVGMHQLIGGLCQ